MNEVAVGCIALVALLLLFFTGLELPFCMILVGFAGFSYLVNFKAATHMVAKDMYDVFVSYGYTVFPLFIVMGQIAFASGIAKKLYDSAYRFFGHIPGGLAVATVAGATAFKALCGSAVATAATFTIWPYPKWTVMATTRPSQRDSSPSSGPWAVSSRPPSSSSSTVSLPSSP